MFGKKIAEATAVEKDDFWKKRYIEMYDECMKRYEDIRKLSIELSEARDLIVKLRERTIPSSRDMWR
jgi:hypothetical protein